MRKYQKLRAQASLANARFYEGPTCGNCGTTKRYVKNNKCKKCHSKRAKQKYIDSDRYRLHQERIVKERQDIIENHKKNPSLSCQRW